MPLLTGTNSPRYSQYTAEQFVGNGSQTAFTLARTPPTPASLIVTIDGVKQHSSTYSLSSNQIVFSEAPPTGTSIECVAIGSQGVTLVPSDDSVTTPKIAADAVTTNKILNSAVTTAKINNGDVTAAKLDVLTKDGTGGMLLPSGPTAQRPAGATEGIHRYNTSTQKQEYFYGNFWINADGTISTVNKTRVAYGFTGAAQSFVVPAGVTSIFVKIWGGGGGGGSHSGWTFGSPGGGGGHTRGILTVTPGQTIGIVCGGGGQAVDGVSAYGGGGIRSTSGSYGAGGGGYSGVFDNSIANGNELMIAGGGGGGGASRANAGNFGGGGGGRQGQDGAAQYDGYYAYRGRGGTQTAGGSGGGNPGSKLQGGQATAYGGGGGGGYYGGSGGSYIEDDTMGGGGGGSGWTHPTRVILGETFTASYAVPAFYWDTDLQGFAPMHAVPTAMGAQPAGNNQGGSGGAGCVVIYY